jgi:hypothetical protein
VFFYVSSLPVVVGQCCTLLCWQFIHIFALSWAAHSGHVDANKTEWRMASLSLSLLPVDTNLAPIELQQKHFRRACVAFRLLSASLGMRKLLSLSPSSHSFGMRSRCSGGLSMRSGNQSKITGSLWLTIFSLRMCTRPQDLLRRRLPTNFVMKNATV